jgi:hypothetical protein
VDRVALPVIEPSHIDHRARRIRRAQRQGEGGLVQGLVVATGNELRLADLVDSLPRDLVPAQVAHDDQARRLGGARHSGSPAAWVPSRAHAGRGVARRTAKDFFTTAWRQTESLSHPHRGKWPAFG